MKKLQTVISIELVIACMFVIGADWAGEDIHRFFHNYFADIALPFGYYFLLFLIEDRLLLFRPWQNKALSVFFLVSMSEALQYFGMYALATVFDPIDFAMYAGGIILAVFVDRKILSM